MITTTFHCPGCTRTTTDHPHGLYCPYCGAKIELVPPEPREDGLSREMFEAGHGGIRWGGER